MIKIKIGLTFESFSVKSFELVSSNNQWGNCEQGQIELSPRSSRSSRSSYPSSSSSSFWSPRSLATLTIITNHRHNKQFITISIMLMTITITGALPLDEGRSSRWLLWGQIWACRKGNTLYLYLHLYLCLYLIFFFDNIQSVWGEISALSEKVINCIFVKTGWTNLLLLEPTQYTFVLIYKYVELEIFLKNPEKGLLIWNTALLWLSSK